MSAYRDLKEVEGISNLVKDMDLSEYLEWRLHTVERNIKYLMGVMENCGILDTDTDFRHGILREIKHDLYTILPVHILRKFSKKASNDLHLLRMYTQYIKWIRDQINIEE